MGRVSSPRRRAALALALLRVAVLAAAGLTVAIVGALSCDESCGESAGWRDDPDAWQWTALVVLGLALPVLGLAQAVALFLRRRRVVLGLLAAELALGLAVLVMLQIGLSASGIVWLVGIAIGLAGAFVAALALGEDRDARRAGPDP